MHKLNLSLVETCDPSTPSSRPMAPPPSLCPSPLTSSPFPQSLKTCSSRTLSPYGSRDAISLHKLHVSSEPYSLSGGALLSPVLPAARC